MNIPKAVKMLSELGKFLQERAQAVDLSKGDKTGVVLVLLILSDVVEQLAEITKLADPLIRPGIEEKKAPDGTLGGRLRGSIRKST
jgi:hypothetical protein